MKFYLSYLFLFLFIISATTQDCADRRYHERVFTDIQVTTDIVYGQVNPYESAETDDLIDISLDFYEPVGDNLEKRPVVVMAFGGAFLFGEKEAEDMQAWCDSLTHRGYACASINYRIGFNILSPRSAIRTVYRAVQDMRAAIRFLKEDPNNQGFNVDPDYIFVGGQSAGAITALHTAFLNEEADRPPETYAGTSFFTGETKDQDCLDCSGNDYQQSVDIRGILSMWGALYLLDYAEADEQSPTLMVHGTLDPVVPYGRGRPFNSPFFPEVNGSSLMQPRFDEVGIYNEFYPYPLDASHTVYGSTADPFPNDAWEPIFANSQKFLTTVMAYDSPTPTGATTVVANTPFVYSVPNNSGTTYCWNITGGVITANNGNQITVEWTDVNSGMVTVEEVNSFELHGNPASLAINSNDALAVELTHFLAFAKNDHIELNWTTATESQTTAFIIEKSTNGADFHQLSRQSTKGNSTQAAHYHMIDRKPQLGTNFYRLRIIDEADVTTFSKIVSVDYQPINTIIQQLFVDNQQLYLQIATTENERIALNVFSTNGQRITTKEQQIAMGINELKITTQNWQRGSYFVQIRTDRGVETRKFIL